MHGGVRVNSSMRPFWPIPDQSAPVNFLMNFRRGQIEHEIVLRGGWGVPPEPVAVTLRHPGVRRGHPVDNKGIIARSIGSVSP